MAHDAIADGIPLVVPIEMFEDPDVAFTAFFMDSRDSMIRLGFLLTGSQAHAEEAVQEAFVAVYQRWGRIQDHGAYLRRTVVNRSTSWHRHRAVARRAESRLYSTSTYVDGPDEMSDALAQLPTRRRAVVVLRYYERLELAEIGAVLGISVGTVKSTLHRALVQLKETLT